MMSDTWSATEACHVSAAGRGDFFYLFIFPNRIHVGCKVFLCFETVWVSFTGNFSFLLTGQRLPVLHTFSILGLEMV